jgi:transcriptional regulator with XRE-family HTH domain
VISEMEAKESQEPGLNLTERVKRYVLEKSKTLAEIHKVTGIPRTTLGGWLKGEKSITTTVFDKICQAYEISPVRLLDVEDSEHVRNLMGLIPDINTAEKAMIERLDAMETALMIQVQARKNLAREMRDLADAISTSTDYRGAVIFANGRSGDDIERGS